MRWAESWPAFVIMSLWLLGYVVTQIAPVEAQHPDAPPGAGSVQAAQGAALHRID